MVDCNIPYYLVAGYVGIFVLIFLFLILRSLTIVKQKEVMVIERFGKFYQIWNSGIHFLLPWDTPCTIIWRSFEQNEGENSKMNQANFNRIDLRQKVFDLPLQSIITRDNVEINVHPLLVFEIIDPVRLCYETYDPALCMEKLVQTTLRSIIGDMGLDDTLASREEINRSIKLKTTQTCLNWGIQLHHVELLEIIPNPAVQEAMHQQLAAERLRRASIVSAEGFREKVKLEAEGNCQSTIAYATGEQQSMIIQARAAADAKLLIAKAEADSLALVAESLTSFDIDATQYMIGLRYMESIVEIATRASKTQILFPLDTDLTGATSILTSQ